MAGKDRNKAGEKVTCDILNLQDRFLVKGLYLVKTCHLMWFRVRCGQPLAGRTPWTTSGVAKPGSSQALERWSWRRALSIGDRNRGGKLSG